MCVFQEQRARVTHRHPTQPNHHTTNEQLFDVQNVCLFEDAHLAELKPEAIYVVCEEANVRLLLSFFSYVVHIVQKSIVEVVQLQYIANTRDEKTKEILSSVLFFLLMESANHQYIKCASNAALPVMSVSSRM